MQPSAGLDAGLDLPHTRTRPMHWLATATALAGVMGFAALLQPDGATATQSVAAQHAPAAPGGGVAAAPVTADGPDPEAADYPVECGDVGTEVTESASSDLDGDGRAETVAVVRCDAGIGTPPSGVYVLAHPADGAAGAPRLVETLMDPEEGMSLKDFTVEGRTISATLLGYSSGDVPRCCPDRERAVKWHWRDGKFKLTALPVPGRV